MKLSKKIRKIVAMLDNEFIKNGYDISGFKEALDIIVDSIGKDKYNEIRADINKLQDEIVDMAQKIKRVIHYIDEIKEEDVVIVSFFLNRLIIKLNLLLDNDKEKEYLYYMDEMIQKNYLPLINFVVQEKNDF